MGDKKIISDIQARNEKTFEYVVIQEEDGGVSCFPFWRFYMSYEEYAKRENQNLICGVNMITGEFLYEERGFWF